MFDSRILRRLIAAASIAAIPALTGAYSSAGSSVVRSARFHLALKRAEPGVNDTIASSPKTLKLWFTESITAGGTGIRVTGPGDQAVTIGAVSVEAAPLSPAVVSVPETLASGTYTVAWRAMADDGHPSMGKFSFTIRPTDHK